MRFRMKAIAVAMAAAGAIFLGNIRAEEKTVDIKGCMKCQNKVRELAKEKTIDWDEVVPKSKTWLAAAEDLGKNKPPKGDDASWKKLCEKYLTNVKSVEAAAEKKDSEAFTKGMSSVQQSCMGCHSKHRAKR